VPDTDRVIRSSGSSAPAGYRFPHLRRGHYAITTDLPMHDRVRVAFNELAMTL
jgi:hypothetical protein